MSTNVATIPQPSITAAMAERYGMAVPAFEQTLRATVIPSNASAGGVRRLSDGGPAVQPQSSHP